MRPLELYDLPLLADQYLAQHPDMMRTIQACRQIGPVVEEIRRVLNPPPETHDTTDGAG